MCHYEPLLYAAMCVFFSVYVWIYIQPRDPVVNPL